MSDRWPNVRHVWIMDLHRSRPFVDCSCSVVILSSTSADKSCPKRDTFLTGVYTLLFPIFCQKKHAFYNQSTPFSLCIPKAQLAL